MHACVLAFRYTPPSLAAACAWHAPLPGATRLAVSADSTALAVLSADALRIHSLASMAAGKQEADVQYSLGAQRVKAFAWCTALAGAHLIAVVTEDGALLLVSPSSCPSGAELNASNALAVVQSSGVEAVAWCPMGAPGTATQQAALAFCGASTLSVCSMDVNSGAVGQRWSVDLTEAAGEAVHQSVP